ncbi:MAG: hypothetical protein C1943_09710 [Halochromatium sp.]|nr:hypothetical protein [Halochromatium sp.]
MIPSTRITIEAGKCSGQPCIRHMRISISDASGWIGKGLSHDGNTNSTLEIHP